MSLHQQLSASVAIETEFAKFRLLDEAYGEIFALGGVVAADDIEGNAEMRMLNEVLAILEKHGAKHPASRALDRLDALDRVQHQLARAEAAARESV